MCRRDSRASMRRLAKVLLAMSLVAATAAQVPLGAAGNATAVDPTAGSAPTINANSSGASGQAAAPAAPPSSGQPASAARGAPDVAPTNATTQLPAGPATAAVPSPSAGVNTTTAAPGVAAAAIPAAANAPAAAAGNNLGTAPTVCAPGWGGANCTMCAVGTFSAGGNRTVPKVGARRCLAPAVPAASQAACQRHPSTRWHCASDAVFHHSSGCWW